MKSIELATGHSLKISQRRRGHSAPAGGPGGTVWPCGEALVQWIGAQRAGTHANLVSEVASAPIGSILELGAGTGVVSIALSLLGAPHVTATDGDPQSCELCEANAVQSGARSVATCPLVWGSAQHLEDALAHSHEGSGRCASWIVCADVVYNMQSTASLELTLRSLLARGGCSLVIIGWVARGEHEEARAHPHSPCARTATEPAPASYASHTLHGAPPSPQARALLGLLGLACGRRRVRWSWRFLSGVRAARPGSARTFSGVWATSAPSRRSSARRARPSATSRGATRAR
eukprot:4579337-Prymnesium_polylepis.1